MNEHLALALREHLADVDPPSGDLAGVMARGRRIRRRRRAGAATAVLATVALVWGGAMSLVPGAGERAADDYADIGSLDLSEGLRAYADPGREIHLGGRTFGARDLDHLDTDAAATPSGVVFYDDGRPMLLDGNGTVRALVDGPALSAADFHPTAKVDSRSGDVAVAVLTADGTTISVHDLPAGEEVWSYEVPCDPCAGVVIDGFDDGVVYLRTPVSTIAVLTATDEVVGLGRDVRIADVRNDVVLYDASAPAPTPVPAGRRDWSFVPGAIDAQLTFDGGHVLSWSSRLEPTDPTGEPLVLDVGPVDGGLGFWTIDTDGSVLVAAPDGTYPSYTVQDCEVPSGRCTELGPLRPTGGDPLFIGNDM